MSNTREKLEELQKNYFKALDEITKARECLTDEIREGMQNDLYRRYRVECDQLLEQAKIDDKNTDFDTALKIYMLTPHKRGFLWLFDNYAKKLKIREAGAECDSQLLLRELAVSQLEQTIDEADNAEISEVIEQPEPTKDDVAAAKEEYKRLKKLYRRKRRQRPANNKPGDPPPASPPPGIAQAPDKTGASDFEAEMPAQTPHSTNGSERTGRKNKAAGTKKTEALNGPKGQLPGQISLSDLQHD